MATNRRIMWYIAVTAGVVAAAAAVLWPGGDKPTPRPAQAVQATQAVPQTSKPRVLYVDSYHAGYPWSEGITQGVCEVLKVARSEGGDFDDSKSPVTFRVCRMDTKRNGAEEFKVRAALQVKQVIEAWQPDVVICADDNASKYVIVPHFANGDIPFVFCGVNWDASAYGFPCRNVTGMLEVSLITNLLDAMRPYARGVRMGLLGADNESNRKEAASYAKLGVVLDEVVFVETFEQWKQSYRQLQKQVDMLILAPPSFLAAESGKGHDQAEARTFVLENTRIPTGSVEDWIAPYSLICLAKLGNEQGEWAAQAALRILAGAPPADIPVASNHHASTHLNMPLAKRMGVLFPIELIEQAVLVTEDQE